MKLNKLLVSFLLAVLFAFTASGQSSAELKKKKQQLQREIDLLQKNANKAAGNKKLTQKQINDLNTKISLMQDKIEVINTEVRSLDSQIHENTNTVLNLKGQLGQLKTEYAGMIRFAQKNRNSYTKMMFIFASADFYQAYKRVKYLQQFGAYRKKQAAFIEGKEKDLKYKIVILDKNLKEKSSLMHEQESEKDKLGQSKEEQAKALTKYSNQEKQYQAGIAERRKKQIVLDREIRAAILRDIAIARKKAEEAARLEAARVKAAEEKARLAREKLRIEQAKARAAEIAKAKAANKPIPAPSKVVEKPVEETVVSKVPSVSSKVAVLSSDFERNRGSLPRPVSGRITEGFGIHTEGQAKYTNNGINIESAEGAAVHAVFNGEVRSVNNLYGRYLVLVSHGTYYTVYHNLRSTSVSVGQKVSTNQVIGTVGNSGDKPLLQFQIWKGDKPQNPVSWLAN